MFLPSRHRLACWKRRGTCALVLAMVALCSVGVPLPGPGGGRFGERFPCENCGCGCSTAENCWRNCCCYNTEQKLAWASENEVAPPEFVLFAAAQQRRADAARSTATPVERRDEHSPDLEHLPPCCRARALAAAQGGSCPSSQETPRSEPSSTRQDAPHRLLTGLYFAALRCRGVSVSVSLLPPALPEVRPTEFGEVPSAQTPAPVAAFYTPPLFDVAAPPPDAVLA